MRSKQLYTSPRAALLSVVLFGLLSYLLCVMPLSGLYMITLALFLYPFLLQVILTVAGPLPALVAVFGAALCFNFTMGISAAAAALAYLSLPLLLYFVCLIRKTPWKQSMQMLSGLYVIVVLAIFLIGRRSLGMDPFATVAKHAADSVQGMLERDYFLDTLYRFGLLSLPEEIAISPLIVTETGSYTFSPEAVQEFTKQITARMDLWLRALLPTLTCSYSIWLAVTGPYISHHYGLKHAQRLAYRGGASARSVHYFEGFYLPAFGRWYIPKQLGHLLLGAGALTLISRLFGSGVMLVGQMLQLVFSAFFGIQGLALINHLQKQRSIRPAFRGLSLVLVMIILPQGAMLIGLYDQLADPRELRKQAAPKDEPPDRRTDI